MIKVENTHCPKLAGKSSKYTHMTTRLCTNIPSLKCGGLLALNKISHDHIKAGQVVGCLQIFILKKAKFYIWLEGVNKYDKTEWNNTQAIVHFEIVLKLLYSQLLYLCQCQGDENR